MQKHNSPAVKTTSVDFFFSEHCEVLETLVAPVVPLNCILYEFKGCLMLCPL